METSESQLLNRISMARGNAEPEQAPTAPPEAVDVSAETPEETEVVTEVTDSTETPAIAAVEAEEEVSQVVTEPDNSEDEGLYVEYKGREINLSEIEEWEQGHLRQSDYTRKTQELADQRKTFEAEREDSTAQHSKLAERIATLDAIIAEDTLTPEALKELREYEPEEFIKYQEKIANRKEKLGAAKDIQPANNIDVEAERAKLWAANPSWLKDGVQTDAFTNDMKAMQDVGLSVGYSVQEMNGITAAKHFELLRLASIGAKSLKSNASIEKMVRKAPVTTKPKAAIKSSIVTKLEKAQAELKRTGSTDAAVKVRQLKRQLTG